jgi:hypothetical protein
MPRAVGRVAFLVVVIALWSRVANAAPSADGETLTLESTSSNDAEGCPDAEVLRARVAERLGRDPFTAGDDGHGKLRVAFARRNKRHWTAAIELFDAENKRIGERSLAHEASTCEPLIGSVVLTIAVLLEDLAPPPPTAAPSPAPPPTAEISPPPDAAPARPTPSPRAARFDVSAGAAGSLGGAPSPSVGADFAIGLDVGRWSFELGGRGYLPASSDGPVAVRTRVVHARFAPCWGALVLSECLVADVGSVSAEAVGPRVLDSRLEAQFYAAGGLGFLSRVFVVDDLLFVRASIDLLFAATRAGFDVGPERVWTVPVVSAAGALALGVRLP